MAWEDSSSCSSPPADVSFTYKYQRSSGTEFTRSGDLNQYHIPGKYWEEAEAREAMLEEGDGSISSRLEAVRLATLRSGKKKSEDACPTFREIPLRARADSQEEMQGSRKFGRKQINEATFGSKKTWATRPRAKEMSGVKTGFATCRQGGMPSEKGTSSVGCKPAGISGLIFSSGCSAPPKSNNGQKRFSLGNLGCTSAPDVYLPTSTSATKVVRASADWDVKKGRQKSSKVSRGSGIGATFASHAGKSSQRRAQVMPHPVPAPQPSRRQTTPVVDPDIWCSRGLSLTTDVTSLDCVVPTGNGHVCARRYRVPNPSESATVTGGIQLERTSRERYCPVRRGEEPAIIPEGQFDPGSDSGRRTIADVASVARSRPVQGSRRSSGGLAEILSALERSERHDELSYEQLLMLEATLLLGGLDMYDQHREWRLDVDNMSYEDLLELGDRIGYVSTGLNEETIIKCLNKKKCISESSYLTENERKCSICQEEYEISDELGKLQCGHAYHVGCIKQWLLQKNVCPVCKVSAFS